MESASPTLCFAVYKTAISYPIENIARLKNPLIAVAVDISGLFAIDMAYQKKPKLNRDSTGLQNDAD